MFKEVDFIYRKYDFSLYSLVSSLSNIVEECLHSYIENPTSFDFRDLNDIIEEAIDNEQGYK